jgi:hypothetical protein
MLGQKTLYKFFSRCSVRRGNDSWKCIVATKVRGNDWREAIVHGNENTLICDLKYYCWCSSVIVYDKYKSFKIVPGAVDSFFNQPIIGDGDGKKRSFQFNERALCNCDGFSRQYRLSCGRTARFSYGGHDGAILQAASYRENDRENSDGQSRKSGNFALENAAKRVDFLQERDTKGGAVIVFGFVALCSIGILYGIIVYVAGRNYRSPSHEHYKDS